MTKGGEKKRKKRKETTTFPCHFSMSSETQNAELLPSSCSEEPLFIYFLRRLWCFLKAQPWLWPKPKQLGKTLRCIAGEWEGSSTAKPPTAAALSFWTKHSRGFLRSNSCSMHHNSDTCSVIHMLSSTLMGHSCSLATYLPPLQSHLILQ